MKVAPLSIVIGTILLAQSAVHGYHEEPLVSLNKVKGLLISSYELTTDSVKFASQKVEESLPFDYQVSYKKFIAHLDEYTQMLSEWYAQSPAKLAVNGVVGSIWMILTNFYNRLNTLNHLYIDPIVSDFEQRFPVNQGILGSELIDRALTIGWLVLCVKTLVKVVLCRRCRSKCTKNRKL